MYQIENSRQALDRRHEVGATGRRTARVARNVLLLGLTSFFTDISAEMVATVLPLYLVYSVGLTPLQFGLVDGVYQGAASVARLLGGFFADRSRRHKEVAAIGYGISAAAKLGLLAVGSAFGAITAMIAVDRTGKGVRTAPRDALISLSSPGDSLGTAYGVHRALDTAGAMLGPLVAFAILFAAPDAFDAVFVASFLFAVVGLAILVSFVQNRPLPQPRSQRLTLRRAIEPLRVRRFRRLVLVSVVLGLTTMSDGFVYLALRDHSAVDASAFPLLYVATAGVYLVLAVPVGRLADAAGRYRVFLGGYAALALVYGSLLLPLPGVVAIPAVLLLFGGYYAATDGVLMALGSALTPAEGRATGLAVLATALGGARLLASVAVGAVWTVAGLETTLYLFGGLLGAALVLAAFVLPVAEREARRAQ